MCTEVDVLLRVSFERGLHYLTLGFILKMLRSSVQMFSWGILIARWYSVLVGLKNNFWNFRLNAKLLICISFVYNEIFLRRPSICCGTVRVTFTVNHTVSNLGFGSHFVNQFLKNIIFNISAGLRFFHISFKCCPTSWGEALTHLTVTRTLPFKLLAILPSFSAKTVARVKKLAKKDCASRGTLGFWRTKGSAWWTNISFFTALSWLARRNSPKRRDCS